ncbi:MAG: hypothetical protein WBX22_17180 [Silvibacterium sp.]|jgi:antirestriction protein ArdC
MTMPAISPTGLEVLKDDKRCVVQAASYAQKAVDYLHGLQPQPVAVAVA